MKSFEIDVKEDIRAENDGARPISIRSGSIVFTRLLRPNEKASDDYLRAPPASLAYWIADNWWRIRWECIPAEGMSSTWRLAHELSSIGGGYVWPRLALWGEGQRVGLVSRCDPPGIVGPVRFLTEELLFIPADDFEKAVFQFLETAADDEHGYGSDRPVLRSLIAALESEISDSEIADWRRLEAQLGFDVDEAPEPLMKSLSDLITTYGHAGVEEAAIAAPGIKSVEILKDEISEAESSSAKCNFSHVLKETGTIQYVPTDPPWIVGETTAQKLRHTLNLGSAPLRNKRLSEVLGVTEKVFQSEMRSSSKNLTYGLRIKSRNEKKDSVALRSKWSHDRRFELTRALGDAMWAKTDALGPLAKSKTTRQKFQRAFAQSFLCPIEGLKEYMNTDHPDDEDISAAARHFHVSERVIQTILVNKKLIPRRRFDDMLECA